MSRPSSADERELELLESIAALNAAVQHCCKFLELRIRQAERRALGHAEILAVLGPSRDELESIAQAGVGIRQLVSELLADRQAERCKQNGGANPPQ